MACLFQTMLYGWHQGILATEYNGAKLDSFDIWCGLNQADRESGYFNLQESAYLTLAYASSGLPVEQVWCSPPRFLHHKDKNVARVMAVEQPIIYKRALLREEDNSKAGLSLGYTEYCQSPNRCLILVPVNDEIENRWKVVFCFSFSLPPSLSPQQLITQNQARLIQLAVQSYKLWNAFGGSDFNLYQARQLLCHNAFRVAGMLVHGFSSKRIADNLNISCAGVEYHIDTMRSAFGANNRGHLIAELFRRGLVN